MTPPPKPTLELPSGDLLPAVGVGLPGPRSRELVEALSRVECPGLTLRRRRRAEASGADHDPIVWSAAKGANVLDVDGNRYVDLTAGFGAALLGHGHPAVVSAVRAQAERMLHALGDVYPSDVKVALEERLASLAPWPARVILGLSGADAVEAALKTAALATGRPGVLAFTGGYHGLSYGALAACGYKALFREPFAGQLNPAVRFAPFPAVRTPEPAEAQRAMAETFDAVERALATREVGAVLVEPILGRGGVEVPPAGFMSALTERAHGAGAVLIADEVQTGLGRTGRRFRSVTSAAVPDVICLGKALGGGLPVSATLVREDLAGAWASARGEAIHTSTFLGNPLGCAAALASLDALEAPETIAAVRATAVALEEAINAVLNDHRLAVPRRSFARLMIGLAVEGGPRRALAVCRSLLERGYVALTGGVDGDVLTLTPPCALTPLQVDGFVVALADALRAHPAS